MSTSAYELPPKNDKPFGERGEFELHITAFCADRDEVVERGVIYGDNADTVITNREVREVNQRLMSKGSIPLFIDWSDVLK